MTQEEIIEGNISIDKFMDNWLISRGFSETELNYNSDYNTLMPVVEKIEREFNQVIITYEYCDIPNIYNSQKQNSKIEAVWIAVVEFINWYNRKSN